MGLQTAAVRAGDWSLRLFACRLWLLLLFFHINASPIITCSPSTLFFSLFSNTESSPPALPSSPALSFSAIDLSHLSPSSSRRGHLLPTPLPRTAVLPWGKRPNSTLRAHQAPRQLLLTQLSHLHRVVLPFRIRHRQVSDEHSFASTLVLPAVAPHLPLTSHSPPELRPSSPSSHR